MLRLTKDKNKNSKINESSNKIKQSEFEHSLNSHNFNTLFNYSFFFLTERRHSETKSTTEENQRCHSTISTVHLCACEKRRICQRILW